MKKNTITYFVSYKYYKHKSEGFGNITYELQRKMDIDLIREIESDLKQKYNFKSCLVLNFNKF